MPQVIRAFLSTEPRQERANCSVDLRNGSRFGAAQTFFEFAVSHLNRVEVRRIFRQVPERRARRFDDLANARTQMDPTIVDDDNVTAPQCWTQTLLQIGQKHLCGHCSLKRHWRSHFVVPHAAMKVIVFQLPSGTRPITLIPRGPRPLSRTMLVV